MREAPGREGRAWNGYSLLPMQDQERGGVTSFNLRWPDFCRVAAALKPRQYNIGALLRDVDSRRVYPSGDALVLPFHHRLHHRRFVEEMECPATRRTLELLVSQAFGKSMRLCPVLIL